MGADSFIAIYGIKIMIDQTDEDTLDALEKRTDSRLKNARRHGPHVYWGRPTDGEDYFLYVGHRIGWLGSRMISMLRSHSAGLSPCRRTRSSPATARCWLFGPLRRRLAKMPHREEEMPIRARSVSLSDLF
jgi:hypothetical protein